MQAPNPHEWKSHRRTGRGTRDGDVRVVYGDWARVVLREALLPIFVPRRLYDVVQPPEVVYYRVYKRGDEYWVFLIYEWSHQVLPPHKHDYQPVIVVLDSKLNVKEVYTDGFHYYVDKYKSPGPDAGRPHIRITAPWRSMEVYWGDPPSNYVMVYPVDEVQRAVRTRLRYLSDHVVHELRSRRVNPLSVHPRLIKAPWEIRNAKHWSTIRSPTPAEVAADLAKNYGVKEPRDLLRAAKIYLVALAEAIRAGLRLIARKIKSRLTGRAEEEPEALLAKL